jgi:hypothetical protein
VSPKPFRFTTGVGDVASISKRRQAARWLERHSDRLSGRRFTVGLGAGQSGGTERRGDLVRLGVAAGAAAGVGSGVGGRVPSANR